MGNPKDMEHSESEAMGDGESAAAREARNAHQANRDFSHKREAALNRQIVEAITRETAKVTMHFQAILNERTMLSLAGSLKVTSRAAGFKVMDHFDWTKDKAIYQRWQMWSEKVRHALEAMEGDSEKTKISYFHHWVDSEGMAQIESWKKNKTLLKQEDYDKLDETQREGKYSLDKIESYFTLFKNMIAPKSNPLLAVEELHFAKQGSMNSGEFHAHVVKIVKGCKFPCTKAEERAIRDTIFLGMNSTKARDKAINLMNEEGKELTVDFLMQQLEIEDWNTHHKSLSQLDSSTSVNFAAYDHQQNKGKNSKKNRGNGKDQGEQGSSNSGHQSRKPPGMEGKCMRCGKHEHQPRQRCPAKNTKCKDCHKIGHFHKVCQSKKRATQQVNLVQSPQDNDNTHIDENGVRQPNPPQG